MCHLTEVLQVYGPQFLGIVLLQIVGRLQAGVKKNRIVFGLSSKHTLHSTFHVDRGIDLDNALEGVLIFPLQKNPRSHTRGHSGLRRGVFL